MKRLLAILCAAAIIAMLAGCSKKDTLTYDGDTPQSVVEASSTPEEIPVEIELQKISELRGDLDRQIESIRNADYQNLGVIENFTVTLPEEDVLYELELTCPELDFNSAFDKFDRVFNANFGDIYSPEDKAELYRAAAEEDDDYAENHGKIPLSERAEKFHSGELTWEWLYVRTNKAYIEMYPFGNGIFRLYRDGVIKRAEPDEEPTEVCFTDADRYFNVVKNSLDVDSDEKYALLDKEVSVKEAAEEVKRLVREHEYSWGGGLDPDVTQVRIIDIGEGKYGLEFIMAPSYKGVLFDVGDVYEYTGSAGIPGGDKENHSYQRWSSQAFIMESGKIETFLYGDSAFDVTEIAEHNSVIPLDKAVEIAAKKFGTGMNLALGRAELIYSPRYFINGYTEDGYLHWRSNPIWKLKCANSTDGLKYTVYVNAVTGEFEYNVTNGWVIE